MTACLAPGSFRKQTFRKSEFELLESCAKDEHLIKSGDTAMDASSQVTLDTMMFGVDGDQDLGVSCVEPIPRAVTVTNCQ